MLIEKIPSREETTINISSKGGDYKEPEGEAAICLLEPPLSGMPQ